ncbi:MAG: putative 4-hydroxybenzoate polyprenyltransferase [Saprospiraceae bacterium]|nr:putative 4-hydroxybenzoate polyprenyltransferase [Saprospiraceae bacterium]
MKSYLSLIKFSHTVFALPFALVGFTLGVLKTGSFNGQVLLLVLLCMIFARSAAMAFNRYLDRNIDQANPRTANREIPAGVISPKNALLFVIINCLLFIATTWFINLLCFYLSPVSLIVVLGYSFTKRFTFLCHFVLGLGLSLAPIGAYLAMGGGFDLIPILFSALVFVWVSGFDIIYALQDEEFDKSNALYSVPATIGKKSALRVSEGLHLICIVLLFFAVRALLANFSEFGWIIYLAAGIFSALLIYQHSLVRPNDLSRVNLAFFTTNGIASVIFGSLFILDVLV